MQPSVPIALTTDEGDFVGVVNKDRRFPTEDLGLEIAKGNVAGHSVGTIFGRNQDLDPGTEALVWDYGATLAREVYLTADTELFMSSSNASDTSVGIIIEGMTDDYEPKTTVVLHLAGQSQQSIGSWFRIFKATVISGASPLGDMYIAEADTLALGVPDTPAKVHGYMVQGSGTTHKAAYTVPVNRTMYIGRILLGTRRGEDAVYHFHVKGETFPDFIEASNFPIYQSTIFAAFSPPFPIAEKTDIEFVATTVTNNTEVTANVGYILVDNTV